MRKYHRAAHTCERAARDKSTSGLGDKIICFGLYWIVKFAGSHCATKNNFVPKRLFENHQILRGPKTSV
jgi:hypothetical protein